MSENNQNTQQNTQQLMELAKYIMAVAVITATIAGFVRHREWIRMKFRDLIRRVKLTGVIVD